MRIKVWNTVSEKICWVDLEEFDSVPCNSLKQIFCYDTEFGDEGRYAHRFEVQRRN